MGPSSSWLLSSLHFTKVALIIVVLLLNFMQFLSPPHTIHPCLPFSFTSLSPSSSLRLFRLLPSSPPSPPRPLLSSLQLSLPSSSPTSPAPEKKTDQHTGIKFLQVNFPNKVRGRPTFYCNPSTPHWATSSFPQPCWQNTSCLIGMILETCYSKQIIGNKSLGRNVVKVLYALQGE